VESSSQWLFAGVGLFSSLYGFNDRSFSNQFAAKKIGNKKVVIVATENLKV